MIMVRSNDILQSGLAVASRIKLLRADVTDVSATLAQRHLCGPTASTALGEALTAVALLGADATRPDETVTFRMGLEGPVGGLVAEASRDGALRGYPNVKIVNALDGEASVDLAAALGESARVQVVRSTPGRILSQASLEVAPAAVEAALEEYYARSEQRRVLAALSPPCRENDFGPMRGMTIELLPDGNRETFDALAEALRDESALEALEVEDGLRGLAEALELGEMRVEAPRPLRFACRCSRDKVEAMLAGLDDEALQEMAARDRAVRIFCHMCGEGYEIEPGAIRERVKRRR